MTKSITFLLIIGLLSSCQLPKDPNKTLQNIQRSHILKVGICSAPNGTKDLTEPNLLKNLSQDLKVELVQVVDVEDKLLRKLETHALDLVMCGIQEDNPWGQRVAFTTPILNKSNHEKYVWAVAQGENAWLKYIDGFIKGIVS